MIKIPEKFHGKRETNAHKWREGDVESPASVMINTYLILVCVVGAYF